MTAISRPTTLRAPAAMSPASSTTTRSRMPPALSKLSAPNALNTIVSFVPATTRFRRTSGRLAVLSSTKGERYEQCDRRIEICHRSDGGQPGEHSHATVPARQHFRELNRPAADKAIVDD